MENNKSQRRWFIQKVAMGTAGLAFDTGLAKVEPLSYDLNNLYKISNEPLDEPD